jgi:chitinase
VFSIRPALLSLLLTAPILQPVSLQSQALTESSAPLLTGYFPQWGLYNEPQYTVKNLANEGGAAMLDQLNYAQGFVTNRHCSIADPNADLNWTFNADQSLTGIADDPKQAFRGNLHQLAELKRRYPHLKVIISLEGKGSNFAEDARPENRTAFVNSCVDLFLKGNLAPGITAPGLFDGIDIDWEYPQGPDADNYLALLKEFRQRMDALRPGLRLNIAVGGSPRMYEGSDMGAISKLVDQIGLMTYDFAGPWSGRTGFNSPLRLAQGRRAGTVENSVQEYLAAGVPASKLLVGIPFYGYGWHMVEATNNGLFQEGAAIRGDRPYREIQAIAQQSTVYRDDSSQAPWLFDGDIFWTYDDPVSIHRKADYVLDQHLGGLMIWELGEDTGDALLLRSAHYGLKPSRTITAHLPPALTGTTTQPSLR